MQKRICLVCGLPWYLAAVGQVWKCPRCGAEIPVEEAEGNAEADRELAGSICEDVPRCP